MKDLSEARALLSAAMEGATPAPWESAGSFLDTAGGRGLAEFSARYKDYSEDEANARLCALLRNLSPLFLAMVEACEARAAVYATTDEPFHEYDMPGKDAWFLRHTSASDADRAAWDRLESALREAKP